MLAGHASVFPRFLAYQIDAKFDFRIIPSIKVNSNCRSMQQTADGFPSYLGLDGFQWPNDSCQWRASSEDPCEKYRSFAIVIILYSPPLPAKFWQTVPFREIPGTIMKRLNIQALSDIISDKRSKLKDSEYIRGLKAIDFLSVGAPSYHRSELPPVYCENAKQTQ